MGTLARNGLLGTGYDVIMATFLDCWYSVGFCLTSQSNSRINSLTKYPIQKPKWIHWLNIASRPYSRCLCPGVWLLVNLRALSICLIYILSSHVSFLSTLHVLFCRFREKVKNQLPVSFGSMLLNILSPVFILTILPGFALLDFENFSVGRLKWKGQTNLVKQSIK